MDEQAEKPKPGVTPLKVLKIAFKTVYIIVRTAWLTVWTLYQIALGAILVLLVWGALQVADYFSLREIRHLRHYPPPTTAFMEMEKDRILDSLRAADAKLPDTLIRYSWIPLDSIPKAAQEMALVAEDSKFFDHQGFDLEQIEFALVANHQSGKPARGASTITQQVAKNLYLSKEKELSRKLREAVITVLLEHYLSKPHILEIYLNVAQFDAGVFGIRAASLHYYGKEPNRLSQEEITDLICLLPSPAKWSFRKPGKAFLQHKRLVLRNYALYKGITNQADSAGYDSTWAGWRTDAFSDLSDQLSVERWKTLRSRPYNPGSEMDSGEEAPEGKAGGTAPPQTKEPYRTF